MTSEEVKAFILAESEFPGPMPWRWKRLFLWKILTGQWASYHRALVRGTKQPMVRRLLREEK